MGLLITVYNILHDVVEHNHYIVCQYQLLLHSTPLAVTLQIYKRIITKQEVLLL